MLCGRLARQFKLLRVRQLHSTFVKNENKPVSKTSTATETSKASETVRVKENVIGSPLHTVTNFDKMILVWVKRFPNKQEIPNQVPIECIQRAHTKARIRVCFYMMGISIMGFITSVTLGKKDVAAGKNMLTERMKWYEETKRKGEEEAQRARNA